MKVKQVEYRKLVSGYNFNNEAYGVVVALDDEEDSVESAIQLARDLVNEWHDEREIVNSRVSEKLTALQQQIDTLEMRRGEAMKNLGNIVAMEKAIRERLGLEAFEYTELPF